MMEEEDKKIEFEFFDSGLPHWTLDNLKRRNEPSSFNCMVNVRRFKLTVELIDEPDEVLIERCKELYKKENNWHNRGSINNFTDKLIGKRVCEMIREEEQEKGDEE
jgi:hypothetical protein